MADQVKLLTAQLKQQNYADVLEATRAIPEQDKSDDLKLIDLVARIKADPESPMIEHYLSESAGWIYQEPDQILSPRAFIHVLRGESSAAIRLYQELGEEQFNAADFNRLGNAYLINHDFEQALRCYDCAIELEPEEPSHLNNKGGALARLQRYDIALEMYEECLRLDPEHVTAIKGKQQLLVKLNQSEDLLDELKQDLDSDPESLEKILAYFNALVQFTQFSEAIRLANSHLKPIKELREIPLKANPEEFKHENKQFNLRLALMNLFESRNMWARALRITNEMLEIHEENPPFLEFNKAEYLGELGRFNEANEIINELEKNDNLNKERIKVARIGILCDQGKETDALEIINTISKGSMFYKQLQHKRADINLTLGRIKESHEDLFELLDSNIMVAVQLINSKNYKPDDAIIEKLKLIARNPFTPEAQRENTCFALALACDKRKEYQDAAEFLNEANALNRRKINYNPTEFTQRCNQYIRFYKTADGPQLANPTDAELPKPIFIVGMPRSGTTLTETIIGTHSQVAPCGELPGIPKISRFINQNYPKLKPYPECIDQLEPKMLTGMANAYIQDLPDEGQGVKYTADKLPHNFVNVGLIHRIFPNAPIIHVMRDPRDNGLSNFQQNFGAKLGGMGFAFDLEHIANEINNYWRIMKHWRKIGVPMIEFWYEDLVNEQVAISKALIQYCGLEWEDKVLEFHKLERRVKTASVGQVRNKIYKSSSQKWRNYEELLQPMIDALDTSVVEFYEPDAA